MFLCHTGGPSALLASIVHMAFSLLYVPVWRHSLHCAFGLPVRASVLSAPLPYSRCTLCTIILLRPHRPRFARRSRAQASVYDGPLALRPSAVPLLPLHGLYFLPFLAVSLVMLCLLFPPAVLLPASWFPTIAFQSFFPSLPDVCIFCFLSLSSFSPDLVPLTHPPCIAPRPAQLCLSLARLRLRLSLDSPRFARLLPRSFPR